VPRLAAGATCGDRRVRLAGVRLYDEIARDNPQPFKQRLAAITRDWARHRIGASNAIPVT